MNRSLLHLLCAACLAGCVALPGKPVIVGSHGMHLETWQGCAVNPQGTGPTNLDPTGFSLASWNLYKQQREGWQSDLERLRSQSDLLLLQEASLDPTLENWLGDRELTWEMTPAFSWQGVSRGVMTVSTVAAVENCAGLEQEPWLGLPKSMLASYYPLAGRDATLLVINLHGVNFTLGTENLQRQLAAAARLVEQHSGPLVVAGDFNTWSDARSAVVDSLAERWSLAPLLFHGQQPAPHLGRTVDHVYFRGLTVLSRDVMRVDSSDHYPLQVRFAVTEPTS